MFVHARQIMYTPILTDDKLSMQHYYNIMTIIHYLHNIKTLQPQLNFLKNFFLAQTTYSCMYQYNILNPSQRKVYKIFQKCRL